ncbi:hypothetical protein AVEN_92594-2-1, partial [Araneus ventricosus]
KMEGLTKRTISGEPQSSNHMNGNNRPNDDELNLIVGSIPNDKGPRPDGVGARWWCSSPAW